MIRLRSVIVTFAGEDVRGRRVPKLKAFSNEASVRLFAIMQYGSIRSLLIRILCVELIISKVGWYPPTPRRPGAVRVEDTSLCREKNPDPSNTILQLSHGTN